jgi:glycosyltransferase involved in cell wall biosynthesis
MTANQAPASSTCGVLFIGTATLPPLGADTAVHVAILRALDRSTHRLHAACVRGHGSCTPTFAALREISDLELVRVNLGPELSVRSRLGKLRGVVTTLPALPSLTRLARYIRSNRIDIIHASDRPRDAAAAVLLARRTGAASVIHCHNVYGQWMSPLLRWALRRADARIGVSDFVTRSYLASGHAGPTTLTVHNGIAPDAWVPGRGRQEAREELGIPDHAPVVITVCRLFPAKGTEQLIRAVAAVRTHHPDVRLVVVGRDLTSDGSYARMLGQMAVELGLGQNAVFTGLRSDVPRLLASADVFALPSFDEPFGLVYAEAMAMQLPVVALATGGAPEVVENGRSGLLSARGDDAALAANLGALLSDARLRVAMGENGRRRVLEHFTIDRMARETAGVFRLVASSRIGGSEVIEGGGTCRPSGLPTSSGSLAS